VKEMVVIGTGRMGGLFATAFAVIGKRASRQLERVGYSDRWLPVVPEKRFIGKLLLPCPPAGDVTGNPTLQAFVRIGCCSDGRTPMQLSFPKLFPRYR